MPIPFVLATIALVCWIAGRIGGRASACLAAFVFILLSTDPYLFGNGANLEHFINFFAVGSLALFLFAWDRPERWPLLGSGACVGAAALVKQVAIVPAVVFAVALALRPATQDARGLSRVLRRGLDLIAFGMGIALVVLLAAGILAAQGAGQAAVEDIFRYGRALATDTLTDPNAPSALIRWVTGNADPAGRLPWPFGKTDYLVWWGCGSWPLFLALIPAIGMLLFGPTTAPRRLVAAWTLAAWAQVILPGLYWPHYYLLPIAGVAIAVALCLSDAASVVGHAMRREKIAAAHGMGQRANSPGLPLLLAGCIVLVMLTAIGSVTFLQIRDYLLVPPEELTIRYKGGRQWVVLRAMGRELARRSTVWADPQLYIWG